ncbi:MAG: hypothetical protein Harvfovirus2_17 [Harvfovirus sp.]|uniref:Uncharacterized protein n=1 Tax=Harvfovirus sp. TaxID=2487768 RepID=A0A3G4ZZY7_9VIRU|nr:MAG: hypothetical protein Harvfovirus2_17 [Harvfovirus sp.]
MISENYNSLVALSLIKGPENKIIDDEWVSYDEDIPAQTFIQYTLQPDGTLTTITPKTKQYDLPWAINNKHKIQLFSYELDFTSIYITTKDLSDINELSVTLEIAHSVIIKYENLMALNMLFSEAIEYADGAYKLWLPCIGPLFFSDLYHNEAYLVIKKSKNLHAINIHVGYFKNDQNKKYTKRKINDPEHLSISHYLGGQHLIYQFYSMTSEEDNFSCGFAHPTFIFSLYFDDYSDNLESIDLDFVSEKLRFVNCEMRRRVVVRVSEHLITAYRKIMDGITSDDIKNKITEYLYDSHRHKFIYVIDLHRNLKMNTVTKPNQSINLSRVAGFDIKITRKEKNNSKVNFMSCSLNTARTMSGMMGLCFSD